MSARGYWLAILFLLVALVGQCAGPDLRPDTGLPPATTAHANSADQQPCAAGEPSR